MATVTPSSSPLMHVPSEAEAAIFSSIPGVPDAPDDIPDPPVPPGTTEESSEGEASRVKRWRQQQREAGKESLTIWLPKELKRSIDETASQQNCSSSDIIQHSLQTSPTVPALPESLLPLAHGFCQYVQAQLETRMDDAGRRLSKEVGATMDEMATYTKGVMAAYGPTPTPYQVTLRATSQEGFPVELTMRKATAAELVEEMGRLVSWLVSNGYSSGAEAWRA